MYTVHYRIFRFRKRKLFTIKNTQRKCLIEIYVTEKERNYERNCYIYEICTRSNLKKCKYLTK